MSPAGRPGLPRLRLPWSVALLALVLFAVFAALGTWQLQRRTAKLALIERVNQRVAAPVAEAPTLPEWPRVNAADDEYRPVRLTGRFLPERNTRVQAVTRLGAGFWWLSPLQQADGSVVLVNRGFVAPQSLPPPSATDAPVTVTGLLRMSEPGGGFLRRNDPAADRWFSRDVAAIAQARGLQRVAPYFVDAGPAPAGAAPDPQQPVGGLTVIAFSNSHLVYALTWFALALMVAAAALGLAVQNAKRHDHQRPAPEPD